MLSYKNYKLLNESLGQTIPLGVRSTPTIGIIGANDIESTLEEARKKCKKMDGDEGEVEPEPKSDEPEGDVEDKIDKKLGKKDDEPEDKEPVEDEPEEKEPRDKEEEPETDEPKEPEDKPTLFQKKQKAKQKKMTKEEVDVEFFQSLSRQLGASTISQKFWDGITGEEPTSSSEY